MSKITTVSLAAALALSMAACSAGGLPTPGQTADASGPTSAGTASAPVVTSPPRTTAPADPSASAAPDATTRPTEVPGPPAALLEGGLEGPVPGELGTFYWDGLGSDSPWIVPSSAVTAQPRAGLLVKLSPAISPERWTVSWSPIRNGDAGLVTAGEEGAGNPIGLVAPAEGGSWGALVELHFPSGERAAFYWRVDVVP